MLVQPPTAPAPPSGSRSDSVRILFAQCVGKGGFGEVYQARMTTSGGLSREVAVKLLLTTLEPGAVLRLRDEARLLAALNHRAILQVYDLLTVEGRPALITEYIDGTDLSGVIAESGALSVKIALEVVGAVAGALDAALTTPSPTTGAPLQLVHRDIKPGNIRLARSGAVKLLDFGIAVSTAMDREAKTGTGLIVGTLGYLAPERLGDPGVKPASDIYALGCVLYEALQGERLYANLTQAQMFRLALNEDDYARFLPARLAELPATLPVPVRSLLADLLAFQATERPEAAELESACEELALALPGAGLRGWARARVWNAPATEPGPLDGRTIDVSAPMSASPATPARTGDEPPLTVGSPHPRTAPRATPVAARPPAKGALIPVLRILLVGGAVVLAAGAWMATHGEDEPTRDVAAELPADSPPAQEVAAGVLAAPPVAEEKAPPTPASAGAGTPAKAAPSAGPATIDSVRAASARFLKLDISGPGSRTLDRKEADRILTAQLVAKRKALADLEKSAGEVINAGEYASSIDALVLLAEANENFAHSLEVSYVPAYLSDDQRSLYRQALEDNAYPARAKAIAAWSAVVDKTAEHNLAGSDAGARARAAITAYDAAESARNSRATAEKLEKEKRDARAAAMLEVVAHDVEELEQQLALYKGCIPSEVADEIGEVIRLTKETIQDGVSELSYELPALMNLSKKEVAAAVARCQ
jgi:serine/threonine protein kinase